MISYCFGIPTINRADLLNESLEKYVADFPDKQFIIVDNAHQDIFEHRNVTLVRKGKNLGVAASWNLLATMAFHRGYNGILLVNDDVYWGQKQAAVDDFMGRQSELEFVAPHVGWCNFLLSQKVFNRVGPFDENFYPAYYEDNDYRYRLKLLDVPYVQSKFLDVEIFRGSQTIAKDPELIKWSNCESIYIRKWGGLPGGETFVTPHNK